MIIGGGNRVAVDLPKLDDPTEQSSTRSAVRTRGLVMAAEEDSRHVPVQRVRATYSR